MTKKIAVITGASRGIGAQIACDLSAEGYIVVINYQNSLEKAQQVLNQCGEGMIYQADVSNMDEVKQMIDTVMETYGRIDVLVNNAGITKDNLILRMSDDDFKAVMDTNVCGTFNCCKVVSKIMMKQRSGSIVNLSSIVGLHGNIGQVNYAASKAAVIGLTKTLALELSKRNIRVNAIAPGFIETDMTANISEDMLDIPMQRLGNPQDISHLVSFLVSDKATYITGQTISVDGGLNI